MSNRDKLQGQMEVLKNSLNELLYFLSCLTCFSDNIFDNLDYTPKSKIGNLNELLEIL